MKCIKQYAKPLALMICVIALALTVLLSPMLAQSANAAEIFAPDPILPGTITTGTGTMEKIGSNITIGDIRFDVYRNTKLRAGAVEIDSSNGHYFDATRDKFIPIGYAKTKEKAFGVGVEVASSLGASVGFEGFGVETTVEIEVTNSIGVSTTLGKGYEESLTYTLDPNVNKTGEYYVVTKAFVREYRFDAQKYVYKKIGTKTERLWYTLWIATKTVDVYGYVWEDAGSATEYYPEAYYYELQLGGKAV